MSGSVALKAPFAKLPIPPMGYALALDALDFVSVPATIVSLLSGMVPAAVVVDYGIDTVQFACAWFIYEDVGFIVAPGGIEYLPGADIIPTFTLATLRVERGWFK